jgi:hypothetical protein
MLPASSVSSPHLFVERPQRVHDLIELDGALSARQASQRPHRLDGACIRSPGREDRPFFVKRQIGIVHHLRGMLKCLGWMQKRIEIAGIVELIIVDWVTKSLHGHPPLT